MAKKKSRREQNKPSPAPGPASQIRPVEPSTIDPWLPVLAPLVSVWLALAVIDLLSGATVVGTAFQDESLPFFAKVTLTGYDLVVLLAAVCIVAGPFITLAWTLRRRNAGAPPKKFTTPKPAPFAYAPGSAG